jgi:hypothetical protein
VESDVITVPPVIFTTGAAFRTIYELHMLPKFPPARSSVYAGADVPIPTLLLLMTMRVTPEVSNANCEVPTRCMPVDRSDTKAQLGALAVPDPVRRFEVNRPDPDTSRLYPGAFVPTPRLVPSNTKLVCAFAVVVLVPFAVRTRLAAGVLIAENPGPVYPVYPV